MKICTILFVIAANAPLLAQETKFVSKKTDGNIEEYHVLKSNPKVKDGTYVKYRVAPIGFIVLETGRYKNGNKDGLWESFYHPTTAYPKNSIKEKGHYVNGKKNGVWMFYYVDTLNNITKANLFGKKNKPDSINIHIEQGSAKLRQAGMFLNDKRVGEWTSFDANGEWAQKYNYSSGSLRDKSIGDSININLNRQTIFLGGSDQLSYVLSFEMQSYNVFSHIKVESAQKETTAVASFTINERGELTDLLIAKSSHVKQFDAELLRLVRSTENAWIPGLTDGVKAASNATVQLTVLLKKNGPQYYEFIAKFEFNKS